MTCENIISVEPSSRKEKHISVLHKHLGLGSEVFRSYIIFSKHCELKEIFVHYPEVKVMNRNVLFRERRYTLADAQTKQAHIDAMS